ncbi:MAG: ribosome-associated translation inhibitor RaiA [Alphaproteobacteria bacterium]|nr:MAG: ribosome-associated translation inhibitor RaiA [Alphaproteobacteria bacterium]
MRYKVSGQRIDIGDALRQHVISEIDAAVEKYAERPTSAEVIFSRDAYAFRCEATVHLSTGMIAAAEGRAPEIYAACDKAVERLEKQLRRYKRRLKNHHRERPVESVGAPAYILAAPAEEEEAESEQVNGHEPLIIAEMEARIPTLSVSEAVMQMELASAPVLVFRNEKHNGLNVVYRREDGNIGWIDPQLTS